ncbi:hypothetical protein YPPY66_2055, partial [Yersinia pestis PY-66]
MAAVMANKKINPA